MEDEKCCRVCELLKPLSCYGKHPQSKDGHINMCKECRREYDKEHRGRQISYSRKYRESNKDKISEYGKTYYATHSEKILEYNRQYALDNLEKFREKSRKYRKNNPDIVRERNKVYKQNNPDIINTNNSIRRAKKKSLLHPEHSKRKEQELFLLARELEEQTGKSYQVDHIFPLSHGGIHHHDNLQVISSEINSAKHNSLTFKHPDIKHWTDLPQTILDMIDSEKLKNAYAALELIT